MEDFGSADSELLREWHYCQKDVLERYGDYSIEALREQVRTINQFKEKRTGSVLLTGRTRVFGSDVETLKNIAEVVQHG
jgi:hypothetical protein